MKYHLISNEYMPGMTICGKPTTELTASNHLVSGEDELQLMRDPELCHDCKFILGGGRRFEDDGIIIDRTGAEAIYTREDKKLL
jgi:hypothetical protein